MIKIKRVRYSKLRKETIAKIEAFGYRADDKNAYWFVAYDGSSYCGFSAAWKLAGPIMYFGPAYTKEEFRGRGVQGYLLEHKIKFAASLGIEKIWSRCAFDNLTSARNLIRAGFNLDRPKVCGINDDGNYSVTLDDSEYISAEKYELFFSRYL